MTWESVELLSICRELYPLPLTNRRTHTGVAGVPKGQDKREPPRSVLFQTRACCAGFFGPQCQACPGRGQNVCSGNGFCLDGVNGTGTCQCGLGFNGTACETCTEGKYGIHCDQGEHRSCPDPVPSTLPTSPLGAGIHPPLLLESISLSGSRLESSQHLGG